MSARRRGAAAVIGVLALAGCAGSPPPAAPATTSATAAPAAFSPAACPNPIYPGVTQLDLGPGVECGYLTVPQDRTRPDGRTLRLAVARAAATAPNPKADPLVYLAGGPGGSGLISAAPRIAAGWNRDRDVIFLDQRGTWKSDPLLSCPEIDAFQAELVGLVTTDPATAARSAAATAACRERLTTAGWDLAAYDTAENAADLADLRTALGIDEWDLYGVSYGTDLALQTVRDHPDGIRAVVLDSVVPPQLNTPESFWPSARSGLDALFAACAAQPACRTAYPTLREDFFRLATDLTTTPRTVTVEGTTVVVDGYKLVNLAVTASLVPGTISGIPALVENLARGDGRLAATALLAGLPPSGVTAYGLALGVFCAESPTTPDALLASGRAALPELPDALLTHPPQIPFLTGDCAAWDVPAAPGALREPVRSDRPVLVLDGALDAITAPANGDVVAATLPHSTRARFADAAHDVLLWSPECSLRIMQDFLDDPAAVDTSCAAATAPAPFT
ncbi:alpha/beta fold hydrolase [Pseudonocardia sp. WMMC193]|uniref:alpha/beta fold hydrolase n=1 Tax=Pseudonocardia sp. WMMC193 TaxID=2911965 RepID=UPI001F47FFB8|nr:alpha/beta hydrolase [Pseudonocardia sp. WMMC193]MCF7552349.1 alpha/beta hydrolase [Pseudonocardia sp. WMMC193]